MAETGLGRNCMRNIDAGPGSTKAKFSSTIGPDIYHERESQTRRHTRHAAPEAKNGELRRTLMLIQRKQLVALAANYGYSNSDDEIEADDGAPPLSVTRRAHRPPHEATAESHHPRATASTRSSCAPRRTSARTWCSTVSANVSTRRCRPDRKPPKPGLWAKAVPDACLHHREHDGRHAQD